MGLELNPTVPQRAIDHHLLDSWQSFPEMPHPVGTLGNESPIPELLAQLSTTHLLQTERLQAQLHTLREHPIYALSIYTHLTKNSPKTIAS
ncbi:MAG: hypothetical protein GDA48_11395 [Hormoscilla sp. GM102CHS1]|nr:hypothetical protein [Hormoscilla sp. GM102CHS1]